MSNFEAELKALRDQIDGLDKQLIEIVNKRAGCAKKVAEVKQREYEFALANGLQPGEILFYRPEREAQVLRRVMANNPGPMDDQRMASIIREVMSACLALEQPMQVAYLGPEGTFTQAAAQKHFGSSVISHPQVSIAQVFSQVESGAVNYGVVPVENSTEGMVSHTIDNFIYSPLRICGEVELRIEHHLLASEATAGKIDVICAHQQALAQCRQWLDAHFPNAERVAVSSNGEAAKLATTTLGMAAIAGEVAQSLYNLNRVASNIEDLANNTTRFLIIGREEVPPSGADKTSIIVSTRNEPGALFKLLEPFEKAGIMLTRIDTRPSRTEKWAYVFFIEFEGHYAEPHIAKVMSQLEGGSLMIKSLGSYPRAVM
ncbi:MAG TPA: prephenate dehydratase [Pseudomonadales bacterium]|nr:prephenate dehydratase [Pseudomonadales bacterium]